MQFLWCMSALFLLNLGREGDTHLRSEMLSKKYYYCERDSGNSCLNSNREVCTKFSGPFIFSNSFMSSNLYVFIIECFTANLSNQILVCTTLIQFLI